MKVRNDYDKWHSGERSLEGEVASFQIDRVFSQTVPMSVNPDRVKRAYEAIDKGDIRTLRLMVRGGVPTSFHQPDRSSSLLTHAARLGQAEVFKWLIENGADPTFRETRTWREQTFSLLECACGGLASPEIVSSILEGESVEQADLDQALLSVSPASATSMPVITALLEGGANVNAVDDDDTTALFEAVCASAEDMAIVLLQAGASPDVRCRSPHREEHSRKTAYEVGVQLGLGKFLAECLRRHPSSTGKKPEIPTPSTARECWEIIERHLQDHRLQLPPGVTDDREQLRRRLSLAPDVSSESIDVLFESWGLHDGSSQIGLFPVKDDFAYLFLSVNDAIGVRKELLEVQAIDSPSTDSCWDSRLPVCGNSAGDYLVIDLANAGGSPIAHFSHETGKFLTVDSSFLRLLQRTAIEIAKGQLIYDQKSNMMR